MSRFALIFIVSVLAFSASGVSTLIVLEPCTSASASGSPSDDGSCPPLCVTCGCCAQAVEPALFAVSATPEATTAHLTEFLPQLPTSEPRQILHVPKARLS